MTGMEWALLLSALGAGASAYGAAKQGRAQERLGRDELNLRRQQMQRGNQVADANRALMDPLLQQVLGTAGEQLGRRPAATDVRVPRINNPYQAPDLGPSTAGLPWIDYSDPRAVAEAVAALAARQGR